MSTPYPSQPRRLMRDPSNKLIGGVCAGLAKYLNMDVNLVRILTVIISLFTGIPIVLYLIALFVMPEERNEPQPPYVNGPQPGAYGTGYSGQAYQQPTYGTPPPAHQADEVWGSAGAPWEQPQTTAPPAAPSPAPAPAQPGWQQPPATAAAGAAGGFGAGAFGAGEEPTRYDTAPVSDDAPEAPVPDAPATAAPEKLPEGVQEPEPTPESEAPRPAPEDTSVWESAPADPAPSSSEEPSWEPTGSDTDRPDKQG